MVVPPLLLQVCSSGWVDQPAGMELQPGGQAAGLGRSPPATSAGLQLRLGRPASRSGAAARQPGRRPG